MAHMTEEEWRGCMSVATANTPTIYRDALIAWNEWNPEWATEWLDAKYTADELMRAFMEAYIQGVTNKLTGENNDTQ
jgi:hypothetical protein